MRVVRSNKNKNKRNVYKHAAIVRNIFITASMKYFDKPQAVESMKLNTFDVFFFKFLIKQLTCCVLSGANYNVYEFYYITHKFLLIYFLINYHLILFPNIFIWSYIKLCVSFVAST